MFFIVVFVMLLICLTICFVVCFGILVLYTLIFRIVVFGFDWLLVVHYCIC